MEPTEENEAIVRRFSLALLLAVSALILPLTGCAESSGPSSSGEKPSRGPLVGGEPPNAACELMSVEQVHALNSDLEPSQLSRSTKTFCAYAAGPETSPTATLDLALVPNHPDYLAAIRTVLKGTRGQDSITRLGDVGLCAQGGVGGSRTQTNLAIQAGAIGEGVVYVTSEPGLPCAKLIALFGNSPG